MSDIVERLLDPQILSRQVRIDAAKEIETLRQRVKKLEGHRDALLIDLAASLAREDELGTLKQAQETGVVWEDCCFEGSPPEPFENWIDWACSRVKRNVTIRSSRRDDFEKAQEPT